IQGQRFDASGSPVGGQFQVNTYTTGKQYMPAVSSDAHGDFAVVWASYGSTGTDTSGRSVQSRLYAASGAAISAEFQVNTYTTNRQGLPSVASDATGQHFVVAWTSSVSPGTDTDLLSAQAQRYVPEPAFAPSLGAGLALTFALARRRERRHTKCRSRRS